jgi:hypothetical protein
VYFIVSKGHKKVEMNSGKKDQRAGKTTMGKIK